MKCNEKVGGKIDLFGLKFSNLNMEQTIENIVNYNFSTPNYICFPSTNTISKAYENINFQFVLNNSYLSLCDGKFTEFYLRLKGCKNIRNVSGYWLLDHLLQSDLKHYFYGLNDDQLIKLKSKIESNYPKAKVLGYKAPPYLTVDEILDNDIIRRDIKSINKLKPDLIWIGISTIKQDFLMSTYHNQLEKGLMLGVGAVLLYHAGIINKGPEWVKKIGMRWIVRLMQEPLRLFRSTIPSLFKFMSLVILQDILRLKINDSNHSER